MLFDVPHGIDQAGTAIAGERRQCLVGAFGGDQSVCGVAGGAAARRCSCGRATVTEIKAEEVRIPRRAREAVAQHEKVLVMNRERPAFLILHPDEERRATAALGRPLRDALDILARIAPPDEEFAADMRAVFEDVGPAPADPWARS
jgi:hypothetical protein